MRLEKSRLVVHLNLLLKTSPLPLIAGRPPVLQSLLTVVVLVQEGAAEQLVGRGNALRAEILNIVIVWTYYLCVIPVLKSRC